MILKSNLEKASLWTPGQRGGDYHRQREPLVWEITGCIWESRAQGRNWNDGGPVHGVQVMQDVAGLVDQELVPEQPLFYGKKF